MFNTDDGTLVVGVADLRKEVSAITKDLSGKKVVIMKRGKPIAVLQDFDEFQEKQSIIDDIEDLVLAKIADERFKKSSPDDYISLEELEKKHNL